MLGLAFGYKGFKLTNDNGVAINEFTAISGNLLFLIIGLGLYICFIII